MIKKCYNYYINFLFNKKYMSEVKMYYCIVNPSARSGKGKEIWEKLEKKFSEKGLEYQAAFTKGPGDAT